MQYSSPRQDAQDKVTGQAVFTRDIKLPGMLYAKILTSPYAHAEIMSLDTSKAEALEGVRDILRFDDPDIANDNATGGYCSREYNILTLPRTADFYQHPMGVAVVAESEEICDRALRLNDIKWQEKPFILDFEQSLKPDAPKLMSEVLRLNSKATEPNTLLTREQQVGDAQKGFTEADRIVEYTNTRSPSTTAGVEAMACVAQWRGEFLDIWTHHPANMQPVPPNVTGLTLDGKPHPQMYVMSRQAHFMEVEVDTETGEVIVTNLVCVNDVGHLLNRRGAEAQQYGGAIMGLGRSATEEKIYCPRTGVGLNLDNLGYCIGTMNDYPDVECILNESHLGYSTYGACGVGEDTGASLSGVTAEAIYNATGKWALDYPLTPAKVLKALGRI